MKKCTGCSLRTGILFFCGLLLYSSLSYTQEEEVEPGRAIGKVSTNRDLIVMEFDDSALGKTNLFDLVGHTRHFTPERPGYRPNGGSVTGRRQLDTARP
jgi:hypothetical protein